MFERFDFIEKCNCCGESSSYTQEVNEQLKIKMCFNCGFTTNTLMKKDSEYIKLQFEVLPDVYKALSGECEADGLIYIPSYVDTDSGIVFAYGTSVDDWGWVAMKKKEDVDNNKKMLKADTDTAMRFESDCYIEALAYIGMLDNVIKAD